MADIIDHALASKHLSSGEAAKLRGLCTWLDSSLSGRALRGAMYALTARQYWDHSTLIEPGSTLHICLQYLKAATLAIPDRSLSLLKPTQRPLLLYTDASAVGLNVRIGALLVCDDASYCTVLDPPDDLIASWKCRADSEVVITPAELFASIVAFHTFADQLRGRDILWFVDNQAAGTCFVKAGSQVPSLSLLSLRATSLMAALGCRVWAEYIPSPDNIADGLSREGLEDSFVATKLASGEWTFVRPSPEAGRLAGLEFTALWEQCSM